MRPVDRRGRFRCASCVSLSRSSSEHLWACVEGRYYRGSGHLPTSRARGEGDLSALFAWALTAERSDAEAQSKGANRGAVHAGAEGEEQNGEIGPISQLRGCAKQKMSETSPKVQPHQKMSRMKARAHWPCDNRAPTPGSAPRPHTCSARPYGAEGVDKSTSHQTFGSRGSVLDVEVWPTRSRRIHPPLRIAGTS